jgi:glycosyltransferase involved in cell wall biosynthesis
MGKKTKPGTKQKNHNFDKPFVSICTPTFNRRPFIPIMFECFRNQTYPRNRMEWIIVDDGTDKIDDLIKTSNISQIKYISLPTKITLGEKRNVMHEHAKGSIIVYMDDDDYYPPERVSHAVETLLANPKAMCVGSSEMYIYFKHIQKMYQSGPFAPNHATAATFAFRRELLQTTQYENTAALAEERAFLKNYTIPFAQLDPLKTILVFSHEHNTFDKRKLLEHGDSPVLKQSDKSIEMFIRQPFEQSILEFFMKDIDQLLLNYEPGDPKNKPDVLKQIKEIEQKRNEMAANDNGAYLMLEQEGKDPVRLSQQDVVNILQQQQQHIKQLSEGLMQLETRNKELEEQLKIMEMLASINTNHQAVVNAPPLNPEKKSDPEVVVEM